MVLRMVYDWMSEGIYVRRNRQLDSGDEAMSDDVRGKGYIEGYMGSDDEKHHYPVCASALNLQ